MNIKIDAQGAHAICRQHCVFVQADQSLRCPRTELMHIVVYVDEQRMSRSYHMDVHAHPDLA